MSHCSLGFRVIFEKPTFVTCSDPIKKIWFSFESFKHFCRHFASTSFLIVIPIFWNHIFTQFGHVQILFNNFVDRTFINIKLIGNHSNCHVSILTNESPHTVDVCASVHRGWASRSRFIFHRFSPIYSLCAAEILEHAVENHYQTHSEPFRRYR
jgi:hypothetical protein